ncbi:MAG: gliding motility-associated C-terminal domain-containing protein [Bacteroidia bacterium]|nr:gliding motility-associated C-terminal domain-containing protein [Bacteroidia bacterium]
MKLYLTLALSLAINTFIYANRINTATATTLIIDDGTQYSSIYQSNSPNVFKFTATNITAVLEVNSFNNFDAVIEVATNASSKHIRTIQTQDNTYSGGIETINFTNLVVGKDYFVSVKNYNESITGMFAITVSSNTIIPPPINDEPANAIEITTNKGLGIGTNKQLYELFTTVGATFNSSLPTPANCADVNNSAYDVWFKVKVPTSGEITVKPLYKAMPNGDAIALDASLALYTGIPRALNLISSIDDIDDALLPSISKTGLMPNSFVYIRYWNNARASGNGGITVFAGANDGSACGDALEVCDFNGVNGSFVPPAILVTPTRPCNMAGNSETSGGPFGSCPTGSAFGTSCGGSPNLDVTIDHNLWVKFTASQASISLTLTSSNCSNTAKPGVQMQIFSASGACCGFAAVSDFIEPAANSGGTITASGLTPGQSYYLMIDPWGTNRCDFVVTGNSGISFGDVFADNDNICAGQSATITAPTAATGYTWTATPGPNPSGTGNVITVSPTVTTTYSVDMVGFCASANTTKSITITVGALSPTISPANTTACKGGTATYSVTNNSGSTYAWTVTGGTFTGQGTNSINVTWGSGTTGNVNVTETAGTCSGADSVNNINLTNVPTAGFSYPSSPVCKDAILLLYALDPGATAGDFTCSDPIFGGNLLNGDVVPFSPLTLPGTYTMTNTVTIAGCPTATSTATYTINPVPLPIITTIDNDVCVGDTGIYSIAATTSTIVWSATGGGVINSGQGTISTKIKWPTAGSGIVSVKETNSFGCVGTDDVPVTINALPTAFIPIVTANDTICSGSAITISATPQPNVVSSVYSTPTGGVALGTVNFTSPILTTGITATIVKYYIETKSTAGCVAKTTRDSVKILVNPLPLAPILSYKPNDSICFNLTDTLKVVAVLGVITNVYGTPSGGTSLGVLNWVTPPIINNITYYFETKIVATGCLSNKRRDSVIITMVPRPARPTLTLAPNDSICLKDSIKFNATVTGPYQSINWYATSNSTTSLGKNTIKVSPLVTQFYYAEVKNSFGCKASEKRDSIKVTVLPLPDLPKLTATLIEICEGDSIVLKATVNPTTATIFWLSGNMWKDTIKRGPIFTSPNLTSSTTYYMGSISKNGCKNDGAFAALPVIVKPLPHVTIASNMDNNTSYVGQTILFTATPNIYDTYKWYIDANEIYVGNNLFETQDMIDNQVVKVLVIEKGCPNWGDNKITNKVLPISNAFTPNGDGKNDLFLKGLEIKIFNRWGQLLFTGNEGWDGKYKGNTVSPGTYYYMMQIKKLNSEEITEKSGSVTVVLD